MPATGKKSSGLAHLAHAGLHQGHAKHAVFLQAMGQHGAVARLEDEEREHHVRQHHGAQKHDRRVGRQIRGLVLDALEHDGEVA